MSPRVVVDIHLAHPCAFHHCVERAEVLLDEADQVHGVAFCGGFGFAEALEALHVGHEA